MARYFPKQLLYRLRNEIPLDTLIADHLDWPSKKREGRFVFVCPRCREMLSGVNPATNLGRCFHCEKNFNTIDFAMIANDCDFVEAVEFLTDLLPTPGDPPGSQRPRSTAL